MWKAARSAYKVCEIGSSKTTKLKAYLETYKSLNFNPINILNRARDVIAPSRQFDYHVVLW